MRLACLGSVASVVRPSGSSLLTRRESTASFIRDDDDDDRPGNSGASATSYKDMQYAEAVARRYEDSLFKEFALCDLKHWRSGRVRTERASLCPWYLSLTCRSRRRFRVAGCATMAYDGRGSRAHR